jgi:hypothetical protein
MGPPREGGACDPPSRHEPPTSPVNPLEEARGSDPGATGEMPPSGARAVRRGLSAVSSSRVSAAGIDERTTGRCSTTFDQTPTPPRSAGNIRASPPLSPTAQASASCGPGRRPSPPSIAAQRWSHAATCDPSLRLHAQLAARRDSPRSLQHIPHKCGLAGALLSAHDQQRGPHRPAPSPTGDRAPRARRATRGPRF